MQKNILCYQMHQKWGDNVMKAYPSIQWSLLLPQINEQIDSQNLQVNVVITGDVVPKLHFNDATQDRATMFEWRQRRQKSRFSRCRRRCTFNSIQHKK